MTKFVLETGQRAFTWTGPYGGGKRPQQHGQCEARRVVGAAEGSLERAFEHFPFLRQRRGQLGGVLSGGQQQMLAIGRILVGRPRVLILDEPSDGIQPSIVEEIGLLIARLNAEKGLTTLLIEQNVDLISSCAHRCLIMEKGAISEEIDPKMLDDPKVAGRYLAI